MDHIEELVSALPDEIVNYIGDLQDANETFEKRISELETVAKGDWVEEVTDPIAKALGSLPEDEQAVIMERLEKLDSLERSVIDAAIEKADTAYIEKARAFDGYANPDILGPAMRRLAATNPEDAAIFEGAFTKAAAQTNATTLYDELGSSIAKSGDAETQIEQIAKSFADADPSISLEEARATAWERNPELYEEHRAEQLNRTRL